MPVTQDQIAALRLRGLTDDQIRALDDAGLVDDALLLDPEPLAPRSGVPQRQPRVAERSDA